MYIFVWINSFWSIFTKHCQNKPYCNGVSLYVFSYMSCFQFQTIVSDSKTLTEEKREEIFDMLNKTENLIGWMIEILSPTYISNSMLRR